MPSQITESLRDAALYFIHGHLRPGEHGLKYQEQNYRENQGTEHRVQHECGRGLSLQGNAIEADRAPTTP